MKMPMLVVNLTLIHEIEWWNLVAVNCPPALGHPDMISS
jgi:hypothetical protein